SFGAAGVSGAISYLMLDAATKTIYKTNNMAVFGGILAGFIAGYTYNRFKDTKLPVYLGFFSGRRLVPIVTAIITIFLAGIFGAVWPQIQSGINSFG
ncbi:PTS transporter subunit EIIC, partial [Bacillus vallismortis]|nr:PTS transporter subunit EIIC [Bacillus vallismortis]